MCWRMAEKIGAALRFLDFSEMKEMQHRDYAANAAALALYRTCQQQQDIRRMHVAVI